MIMFERGQSTGKKNLGAILKHRLECVVKNQLAERKQREKNGCPPADVEPCEKCGVWEEEPLVDVDAVAKHLHSVTVSYRCLSLAQVRGARADLAQCYQTEDFSPVNAAKLTDEATKVQRRTVKLMLESISCLHIEGSITESQLDQLEDNGLLDAVQIAGLHTHDLYGEERKNCGALPPLTSPSSTATLAPLDRFEPGAGVMVPAQKYTVASTQRESAPDGL